jgi:hypothetical protein
MQFVPSKEMERHCELATHCISHELSDDAVSPAGETWNICTPAFIAGWSQVEPAGGDATSVQVGTAVTVVVTVVVLTVGVMVMVLAVGVMVMVLAVGVRVIVLAVGVTVTLTVTAVGVIVTVDGTQLAVEKVLAV